MVNRLLGPAGFVRAAGAAAIGFALLIVAGNLLLVPAGMPAPGATPTEAIEFFTGAGRPTTAVAVLMPSAWALAAVFGAGALAAILRSHGQQHSGWAYLGFAGILLQNATFTVVVALRLAMSTVGDTASINTLWALHEAVFGFNGTFLALAMTGLGVAGFRAGLLPRWQLALGAAAALLQFSSATLTPLIVTGTAALGLLGLAGWLLWVLWLIGYGIALFRHATATGAGQDGDARPD